MRLLKGERREEEEEERQRDGTERRCESETPPLHATVTRRRAINEKPERPGGSDRYESVVTEKQKGKKHILER